nr:MAG TPA: hypothetical protein [Caudoviricetes sp.]
MFFPVSAIFSHFRLFAGTFVYVANEREHKIR